MALVVFTGGARSGKSTAAQDLARRRHANGIATVVTVFGRESDEEMQARIARHKADRPEGFETLAAEDPVGWLDEVPEGVLLVVDCLGTLVGRVMELAWAEGGLAITEGPDTVPESVECAVSDAVSAVVARLIARRGDTIVVTNEVGDGVVPAYPSGRLFRDILGSANRTLVEQADAAYLCVAGRLVDLVVLPRGARWPED
jgi:adenosylcobinamide kinase / adenosylcobinamide-phosphate guanylyltransferase